MMRKWTEEELRILREYYPKEGGRVLDRLPGRTYSSITSQAFHLGIWMAAPQIRRKSWSKEEDDILRQHYPMLGPSVTDKLPGRTQSACRTRANHLGLKTNRALRRDQKRGEGRRACRATERKFYPEP